MAFLGLESLKLSPASFRAGGATALLEQGLPPNQILFRGGWTAESSLRSYLQEAEAAASYLSLEEPTVRRLEHLLKSYSACRWPPSVPYSRIREQWTISALSQHLRQRHS